MDKPLGHRSAGALAAGLIAVAATCAAARTSPFATRVVDYAPAPGQFVNSPDFNNPAAALGPPVGGGTVAADNSKVVTLGGFGGSITLAFDHTLVDQPASAANPQGLDLIVFGNAFFVGGNPNRRWAEAGVIEISRDANYNGLADDAWFVIPGTHLSSPRASTRKSVTYSATDPLVPPADKSRVPAGRTGQTWTVTSFALPLSVFTGPVVVNPLGTAATVFGITGYADCAPTLVLGDLDGDNLSDDPFVPPEDFYTKPSDPTTSAPTPGSGGGDAIDFACAVDPTSGAPAGLDRVDFVRITTAVDAERGLFGEASVELTGVAEVRARGARDYNRDGFTNLDDLGDFITDFYMFPAIPGGLAPEAPTYADVHFDPRPCPDAPDAPAPYPADAYRAAGFRAGFALPGTDACPPGGPNLDNLGDFITAYYAL